MSDYEPHPKPIVVFHADFDDRCVTSVPHKGVEVEVTVSNSMRSGSFWDITSDSIDEVVRPPDVTVTVSDRHGVWLVMKTCGANSSLSLTSRERKGDWVYVGHNLITVQSREEWLCGKTVNLITFHNADVCQLMGGPLDGLAKDVPTWVDVLFDGDGQGTVFRYKRSQLDRNVFLFDGIHARLGLEE